MLRLILKPILVVGIALTGAACVDDGSAAPRGYYQQAPAPYYGQAYNNPAYNNPAYNNAAYNNPYYNNGYAPQQAYQGGYYQAQGPRYTTVTVTNRGQNGYRDEAVQQQVACGSQYYDGFRNRTAPRC